MAQQNISVGGSPNDGTGDYLRNAMIKIQNNFSEFYSVFTPDITSNNSTVANNLTIANNITVGANVISNNLFANTKLQIGAQAGYNFGSLAVIEIDASQNTYVQTVIQNANSGTQASGDLVVTADNGNDSFGYVDLGINSSNYSNSIYGITGPGDAYLFSANTQLVIGTASVKDLVFHSGGTATTNRIVTVNTSAVTVNSAANLTVLSNTLNLGTFTNGANGYTYLPNGFKMNWGWVAANSSVGTITFSSPYTSNSYSIIATSNVADPTYRPAVTFQNSSIGYVRTANTTSANVFWQAIGY